MNKPLVLAMCDVLVLSALSLSTGNFSDGDGGEKNGGGEGKNAEVSQPTGGSVTNPPSGGGQKEHAGGIGSELDIKIKILQEQLMATNQELVLVRKDRDAATNNLNVAKMALSNVSNLYIAAEGCIGQQGETIGRQGKTIAANEEELCKLRERIKDLNETIDDQDEIIDDQDEIIDDQDEIINDNESSIAALKPDAEELRRRQRNSDVSRNCAARVIVNINKKKDEFWSPVVKLNGDYYVLGTYSQRQLKKISCVKACIGNEDLFAVSAQFVELDGKPDLVAFKLEGVHNIAAVQFATAGCKSGNAKKIVVRRMPEEQECSIEDASAASKIKSLYHVVDALKESMPIGVGDCIVDEEEACIIRIRVSAMNYENFGTKDVKLWSEYRKIFR